MHQKLYWQDQKQWQHYQDVRAETDASYAGTRGPANPPQAGQSVTVTPLPSMPETEQRAPMPPCGGLSQVDARPPVISEAEPWAPTPTCRGSSQLDALRSAMMPVVEYSRRVWVAFSSAADAELPGGTGIESHMEAFRGATSDPVDIEVESSTPSHGTTQDGQRQENISGSHLGNPW